MTAITLTQIEPDDLRTLIHEAVVNALSNSPIRAHADQWMDLNQLVQYDPEQRSKDTFYGYVSKRTIPFHKRGKKLLFLKSEIDEWLRGGRVRTVKESQKRATEN